MWGSLGKRRFAREDPKLTQPRTKVPNAELQPATRFGFDTVIVIGTITTTITIVTVTIDIIIATFSITTISISITTIVIVITFTTVVYNYSRLEFRV